MIAPGKVRFEAKKMKILDFTHFLNVMRMKKNMDFCIDKFRDC